MRTDRAVLVALTLLAAAPWARADADAAAREYFSGGFRRRATPEPEDYGAEIRPLWIEPAPGPAPRPPPAPVAAAPAEPEVPSLPEADYPGEDPSARPAAYRLARRTLKVRARAKIGQADIEHTLELVLADFTHTRFTFWLDRASELLGVESPWGPLEPIRTGEQVVVEVPYSPYRERLELVFRTRIEGLPEVMRLDEDTRWTPATGGPQPETDLRVWTPDGTIASLRGEPAGRRPSGLGNVTEAKLPAGTAPSVLVGAWQALTAPRVELLVPGTPTAGDTQLLDYLARTMDIAADAFGLGGNQRVTVILEAPGMRVPEAPDRIVLDPEDPSWTASWRELARRVLRIAWDSPAAGGGWLDEAIPAYLAVVVPRPGERPEWPEDAGVGISLGPKPKGDWSAATARWRERTVRRGVPVLRGLRATLGKAGFATLLLDLRGAESPRGTEALHAHIQRPELDGYLRGVIERGEALDFRVEQILAGEARRREVGQGDSYRTVIQFRLARGARFVGPVPVVLETDYGTLKRVLDWTRPDHDLEIFTRARVRKVTIDPEGWYPDPNRKNNQLGYRGDYRLAGDTSPRRGRG